jgi:hypothetical protein
MKSLTPPAYVNVPVAVAYAGVDDALVVTMTRILGLCWNHGYRHTPALTPSQLCEALGRPRATMYRHLRQLEEQLGWLRVDRVGPRLLMLHALVDDEPADPPAYPEAVYQERLQALVQVGIEHPFREPLASDPEIDPRWIPAWHLWTRHPSRRNLVNPAGVIVRKLQSHEPPPDQYLRLATLTVAEREQLRVSYWVGEDSLDAELRPLRSLFFLIYGDRGG